MVTMDYVRMQTALRRQADEYLDGVAAGGMPRVLDSDEAAAVVRAAQRRIRGIGRPVAAGDARVLFRIALENPAVPPRVLEDLAEYGPVCDPGILKLVVGHPNATDDILVTAAFTAHDQNQYRTPNHPVITLFADASPARAAQVATVLADTGPVGRFAGTLVSAVDEINGYYTLIDLVQTAGTAALEIAATLLADLSRPTDRRSARPQRPAFDTVKATCRTAVMLASPAPT
jgi:hypothetical protein